MNDNKPLPEFRFYYFTNRYEETVFFYEHILQLELMRSWYRGNGEKGCIFYSPNGTGLIEIEEGPVSPVIQGALYIQVEDVDKWYEIASIITLRSLSRSPIPLMGTEILSLKTPAD